MNNQYPQNSAQFEQGNNQLSVQNNYPPRGIDNLLTKFGQVLSVSANPAELKRTLTKMVFKREDVNDEQIMAFLMVANEYNLNPFLKEIYAYPDKGGNLTPLVGYDGWIKIINENPNFSGIETKENFSNNEIFSCTCTIWRKDRNNPITITEYLSECFQPNSQAWQKYKIRMLRNKAIIQCARLAFGYSGIYDEDEAQRISESQPTNIIPEKPKMNDITFNQMPDNVFSEWLARTQAKEEPMTIEEIVHHASAKGYVLTEFQREEFIKIFEMKTQQSLNKNNNKTENEMSGEMQ